jgi:hypothetical protein
MKAFDRIIVKSRVLLPVPIPIIETIKLACPPLALSRRGIEEFVFGEWAAIVGFESQ